MPVTQQYSIYLKLSNISHNKVMVIPDQVKPQIQIRAAIQKQFEPLQYTPISSSY